MMQLDVRSNKILDELINNPSILSKDIEKKYNLTRRQLGYSFQKINDWLLEQNLPLIERTRQGHFIMDQTVFSQLAPEQEKAPTMDTAILTEKQRVYAILMMLLSTDDLSLVHFTSALDVSKNTVLSDLKQVQKYLQPYDLKWRYSRRYGYLLEGDELLIRKLLRHILYKILEMNHGEDRLCQLAAIDKQEIREWNRSIEHVEKKLNLKFTDEKLHAMPYIFILLLRRIKRGHKVHAFFIHYEELSDTKEYRATEEILSDCDDIPRQERLFITLHLLTTNVYWSERLTEDAIPNLKKALNEMLDLFEKKACVVLQEREQLLNKLLLHVKPAYYRIKYHLTELNDVQESVSKDFQALHHLVKKSTKPLADLIGAKIPESETIYLTMLIGGWMTRQGDSIKGKIKAIVVCPKGVSVSGLMLTELRSLFPEFVFLDAMSVREFQTYPINYDIVFSPINLETDKKVFIADSFLEREDKNRLRKQVMMELHGYIPSEIHVEDIIAIVKNHATIADENELSKDLYRYIHRDDSASVKRTEQLPEADLSDLITPEHITLRKQVASWEEAIRVCAQPLLQKRQIEQRYIEAMVAHCQEDPYIVIGPHIAIPHAAPEEGVNDVAMSLLKLDEAVHFTEGYAIHVIIVIAAVDKQKHLKALMQLMKLSASKQDRDGIIRASSATDIHKIIQKYAIDEQHR
ncbi:BglG family transcription antiterminator [Virgibacillus sp. 179-BFC.A HS]|uniref:Ascorbate-specific PTS system EIIA component n=1 Tax=Tigheibacillus jepli TaxID=3035914 RepID=A0ABU5CE69_9BACI|nr:BglG family transcription antiterminator [Virgibacillus sp. 179-BFC.A HS]MDY0404628.1 BglG family transcription antiterminator [Virgibacillus sp. 179-BFC.A HS]